MNVNDVKGIFTILSEPVRYKNTKHYKVKVRCLCGNIKWDYSHSLKRRKSCCLSCDLNKKTLRVGKQKNGMTILECFEDKRLKIYCSHCGSNKIIDRNKWARGKSCGCFTYRNGKGHPNFTGHEGIRGSKWLRIKNGAKVRNLEFNITMEYIWGLFLKQNAKCALTGLEINIWTPAVRRGTASLDRIDPKIGYIEGNVQWVHKDINRIKQNFTEEDLLRYCKLLIKHSRRKK